jgi:hypothetical protein
VWQGQQCRSVYCECAISRYIARSNKLINKLLIGLSTIKVTTAAQDESLIERRLEMAMRTFHRAVLVAHTAVVPRRSHAVVSAQLPISRVKSSSSQRFLNAADRCRQPAKLVVVAHDFPVQQLPAGLFRGQHNRHERILRNAVSSEQLKRQSPGATALQALSLKLVSCQCETGFADSILRSASNPRPSRPRIRMTFASRNLTLDGSASFSVIDGRLQRQHARAGVPARPDRTWLV